jgi:hypothetical protein
VIVIDASAMIDLLDRAPSASRIEALLDNDLAAPDLLIAEVARHLARRDRADPAAARRFDELLRADIEYVPVWPYAHRVWELRHNLSPYDALRRRRRSVELRSGHLRSTARACTRGPGAGHRGLTPTVAGAWASVVP